MAFKEKWTAEAATTYGDLRTRAKTAFDNRQKKKVKKSSPIEGLFKQVEKTVRLLLENPKHPGLKTHEYDSIVHPYNPNEKVFEAYAQNNTPGAYRVFWCYGPDKGEITLIAITPHP
jgi:hypothetical protein